MSKIGTLLRIIKNKKTFNQALANNIGRSRLSRIIPSKIYLRMMYKLVVGNKLNLKNPKTFNEKLQWLKIYNKSPEYIEMVDKYDVKEYVSRKIGEDYIIKTLGVWDSVEKIDIAKLPDRFVLKCTHDSGSTFICKSKETFNFELVKSEIRKKLKSNLYWWSREWPYKNVKPRIIAEELLHDDSTDDLRDYKFMCFNGEVKCSFVCSDRHTKNGLHVTFFDRDWNVMPFERSFPKHKDGFPKPVNYEKMIEFAEMLSKDIPFVRVDFYEVNGKIYFGELTFFPGAGMEAFDPEEWDLTLGSWIELPKTNSRMK